MKMDKFVVRTAKNDTVCKEDYDNDPRLVCKYGSKCYQKNPQHKAKYKHANSKNSTDDKTKQKKRRSEEESQQANQDLSAKRLKVDNGADSSAKKQSRSPSPHISPVSSPPTPSVSKSPIKNESPQKKDIIIEKESYFTEDEEDLPDDPPSVQESIKQKFLVKMPKDFYKFWKFCKDVDGENPLGALSQCQIRLVGAYDVLAGTTLAPRKLSRYLCHWRYYYDPPEFQTVLQCSGGGAGYHIGYFRDSPDEAAVFLASMSDVSPGKVTPLADNIFDAVRVYCQEAEKSASPFSKAAYSKLGKKLDEAAKTYGFGVDTKAEAVKQRRKRVVSRSFHGAGIVVPVDKKTDVGYREIPETDATLKRMFKKFSDAKTPEARKVMFTDIQELMTNAQWATDEGDFGMGLELGMAMFIDGNKHFHRSVLHLMPVAYSLLNRDDFSNVLKAHLKNRREGHRMSAFDS